MIIIFYKRFEKYSFVIISHYCYIIYIMMLNISKYARSKYLGMMIFTLLQV